MSLDSGFQKIITIIYKEQIVELPFEYIANKSNYFSTIDELDKNAPFKLNITSYLINQKQFDFFVNIFKFYGTDECLTVDSLMGQNKLDLKLFKKQCENSLWKNFFEIYEKYNIRMFEAVDDIPEELLEIMGLLHNIMNVFHYYDFPQLVNITTAFYSLYLQKYYRITDDTTANKSEKDMINHKIFLKNPYALYKNI